MLRKVRDTRLWVEDVGEGPPLVFSHGLLWSTEMWQAQVKVFAGRYRCVMWDHRGQGRSDVPNTKEVSIETCTDDAIALLEDLHLGPVRFAGLSMGGFVGMRIAARRPDLVERLALIDTSADGEAPANVGAYKRLNRAARVVGVPGWLADRVMPIMFAKSFLQDPQRVGEVRQQRRRLLGNEASIYKAVKGVIHRSDVSAELALIKCPTAVIWGTEDVAISRERARAVHEGINGSTWTEVAAGGHMSAVDAAPAVNAALEEWLA